MTIPNKKQIILPGALPLSMGFQSPLAVDPFNVPTSRQMMATRIRAIVASHPITSSMRKGSELTQEEFDLLAKRWADFTGPVSNLNYFCVCNHLDSDDLWAVAEYKDGRVRVRLRESGQIEGLVKQPAFQGFRIAPKKDPRPNDRCPCKSGRKWKKCCGR